jgi:hypothetical protein
MLKPFGNVSGRCRKPSCYASVEPRNIDARLKQITARHAQFLLFNLWKHERNGDGDTRNRRCMNRFKSNTRDMAEEYSNTLKVILLMIAFAGLMATVCFGLLVLLINVVGRLWPSKPSVLKDKGEVREGISVSGDISRQITSERGNYY